MPPRGPELKRAGTGRPQAAATAGTRASWARTSSCPSASTSASRAMSGTPQLGVAAASTPTPAARRPRRHMGALTAGPAPCAPSTAVSTAIAASATSLRPPATALYTTDISSSQPWRAAPRGLSAGFQPRPARSCARACRSACQRAATHFRCTLR